LAVNLGVGDQVRFLAHRERVDQLLHAADVFVMPSLVEGFGIAALEAMGAGVPTIPSKAPGLDELGRNIEGTVSTGNDPGDLARKISEVYRWDDDMKAITSARLHAQCARRYAVKAGVEAYLAVYRFPHDVG
jgi:glycosyltransferase involved in cell wall biosynthesis